jgi:maltooligosyltrehalose synthase
MMSLTLDARSLPRGPKTWAETRILLPEWATARSFRNVLSGETLNEVEHHLSASEIFHTLPVALLWADTSHG